MKSNCGGTQYFLLTKTTNISSIDTTTEHQIICPHASTSSLTFLLPKVNLTYYHQHGLFESALMDWAKQFCSKDGLFLDIGAHTGTYEEKSKYDIAPFHMPMHVHMYWHLNRKR